MLSVTCKGLRKCKHEEKAEYGNLTINTDRVCACSLCFVGLLSVICSRIS
jgi:hypothetical protein